MVPHDFIVNCIALSLDKGYKGANFETPRFGQYRRWAHISILDAARLRLREK
jgi:hypothetical protein